METVILNWNKGENDPFSVVNEVIRQHFEACGKSVSILEISQDDWIEKLAAKTVRGVDFVYTWQGLGSHIVIEDNGKKTSLWELLKTPLICVHGDHPSHYPPNHRLESRYCFHLYNNAEYIRYSNQHFRRVRSAGLIDIPRVHMDPSMEWQQDECFVIAKNLTDPAVIEAHWRAQYDQPLYEVFMAAAEILKHRVADESYVDVHGTVDKMIEEYDLERIRPEVDIDLFHKFHSSLDIYLRNYKSIAVLVAMKDFPVRIYGRGWEKIAQTAPKNLVFQAGRNMADSQSLFYTRYGIVDISPAKALHDRTRRAMANGCSFLSNAYLEDTFAKRNGYAPLFYGLREDDLGEKCAKVMSDPEGHRQLAKEFADAYHDRFHYRSFVSNLDLLAQSIERFS